MPYGWATGGIFEIFQNRHIFLKFLFFKSIKKEKIAESTAAALQARRARPPLVASRPCRAGKAGTRGQARAAGWERGGTACALAPTIQRLILPSPSRLVGDRGGLLAGYCSAFSRGVPATLIDHQEGAPRDWRWIGYPAVARSPREERGPGTGRQRVPFRSVPSSAPGCFLHCLSKLQEESVRIPIQQRTQRHKTASASLRQRPWIVSSDWMWVWVVILFAQNMLSA